MGDRETGMTHVFFFFPFSPAGAAIPTFFGEPEHDDKRLKRAERDQREKINFSPLDPVTPEPGESLSGSPSRVRRGSGDFEVGSGRMGGWYCGCG